jgi:hypothetical protein
MLRTMVVLAVFGGLLMLGGCRTYEDEWTARTGSPMQPPSAPPAVAASDATHLRGCLSGANRDFTLVDAHTATLFRLDAENSESLRLNAGRLVEIAGERRDAPGAPHFAVQDVKALADSCPAVLAGGTNELNRPPGANVQAEAPPIGAPLGVPRRETPPASSVPR